MRRASWIACAAWITCASTARANPVEVFGFGSEHAAEAGVGVAATEDFAAVYYNPAGLGAGTSKSAAFGFLGVFSNLKIDGRRQSFSDPVGMLVGVTAPAPLGGSLAGRIRVGAGMYLLPGTIARVVARSPDEPFYPWYDNRLQRIVILPGVGVKVIDHLWVGVSANFLAGLQGGIIAGEGSTRALEARVDEKVPAVARVIAGVVYDLTPQVRIGAVYRERFEVPFSTQANTEVAGEPIDLDLRAVGQFTPNQVGVGVRYGAAQGQGSVDVTWSNWSEYPGPFVIVNSALPLVGPLAGALPDVPYKDTIAVRLGGEVRTGRMIFRGGYGFESSPIPGKQTGVTNLLDGPKHTVGLGLGVTWQRKGGKHARLDLHVQSQLVQSRSITKAIYDGTGEYDSWTSLRDEVVDDAADPDTQGDQISNPGYPGLKSGGAVFSGGLTLSVDL